MSDWPEAPRLKAALQERASEVSPGDGWDQIVALTEASTELSDGAQEELPEPDIGVGRSNFRPMTLVSVAAALMLIVAAAVFFGQGTSEEIQTDVADEAEPVRPEEELPSPEPAIPLTFTPTQECVDETVEASEYRLETDTGEEVRFSSRTVGDDVILGFETFLVVAAIEPLEQSQLLFQPTAGRRNRVTNIDSRDASSLSELESLVAATLQSVCAGVVTMVAHGSAAEAAVEVACESTTPPGFHGLVVVDGPTVPPVGCRNMRPTFLIGATAATDPGVMAWAELQGCAAQGESLTDEAGTTVTRWSSCTSTLVHVQTVTPSAWETAEIEGVDLHEFIARITDLPG